MKMITNFGYFWVDGNKMSWDGKDDNWICFGNDNMVFISGMENHKRFLRVFVASALNGKEICCYDVYFDNKQKNKSGYVSYTICRSIVRDGKK